MSSHFREGIVRYKSLALLGYLKYRIGTDGSVWSSWLSKLGVAGRWKKLKPIEVNKYLYVVLYDNGKSKRFAIHQLVLRAFIGRCPKGMCCCHYDGDPSNNQLDNLRWDTPSNNHVDKKRHGTSLQGESNPRAKLNSEAVHEIRRLCDSGVLRRLVAKRFGVATSTVDAIVWRKAWRYV